MSHLAEELYAPAFRGFCKLAPTPFHYLPYLYKSIELSYSLECQFVHQVDLVPRKKLTIAKESRAARINQRNVGKTSFSILLHSVEQIYLGCNHKKS